MTKCGDGVRLSLLWLFGARRFFWHGFHGLRGLGLGEEDRWQDD